MSSLSLVKLWLWTSVSATFAGWFLSAIGQLNRCGYAVIFAVVIAVALLQRRPASRWLCLRTPRWKKIGRRFRRPASASFLILTFLVFLGGILYATSNYTALTYRIPRVLHWLAHDHWYWIHTANFRMNDRACGIEWLSAPLLLFTGSDRGLFLLNFFPFLLLPGLIFSLFTGLGVRPRVAWQWMWLLPTGYDFLLQGASTANDTFPTVYALAALEFGRRAWTSRRPSDLWHSCLAAALLVGAKASNLPLLLPWAILMVPLVPLLARKPVITALVFLLAATVSFLPTAALNVHYCGDWSGLKMEDTGMDMKNPVVGVWGNALLLLVGNFAPPFFPQAGWWNQSALSLAPHFITGPMNANFEAGYHLLGELPTEDVAGIGFGVSALLVVAVLSAFRASRSMKPPSASMSSLSGKLRWAILIAPWISLLAYCMKSGMVTPARLIAPYYPLLLPLLLVCPGHVCVVRRPWWRVLVWGNFLVAVLVLVLTPGRPLWPAEAILSRAVARHPDQHLLGRALKVYQVYATRSDPLADVRSFLPAQANVVGFMGTEDDTSISLWRPLGSRRVEDFLVSDSPAEIRRQNINYVVVGGFNLKLRGTTLDKWLGQSEAELLGTTNATMKVSEGAQPWYVIRLK